MRTSPLRLELFYLTGAHLADSPGIAPRQSEIAPAVVADDSTASADVPATVAGKGATVRIEAREARELLRAERLAINTYHRNNAFEFEGNHYRAIAALGGAR